jgi:uncharacterized protein
MRAFEPLRRLAARYQLQDIYVFGSRAQEIARRLGGEGVPASSTSDVDIAVQPLPAHDLDVRERVRLTAELEELFDAPRVDLVVLSEAGTLLALEVIRGELLFTVDPHAQAEHELYLLRRAADTAHLRRERVEEILYRGAR